MGFKASLLKGIVNVVAAPVTLPYDAISGTAKAIYKTEKLRRRGLKKVENAVGSKLVGKGTKGKFSKVSDGISNAADAVGSGVGKGISVTAKLAGKGLGKTAKFAYKNGVKPTAKAIGKTVATDTANAALRVGKGAKFLAENMVDVKKNKHGEVVGLKTTRMGKSIIFGAAALTGLSAGYNEATSGSLGQVDTKKTTATPDFQPKQYSYLNNGGATGDLVFALNANRRG